MADKRNVLVGAASLFLGPAGTGRPAFVNGAVGTYKSYRDTLNDAAETAWDDVGYTQEGLEVSNEPDFGDVEVDQLLDSARIFKQSMRFSVNTTLAEATLENLLIAWGQRDDTVDTVADGKEMTIEGGALGEAPLERGLIAVGNGPELNGEYAERVYHVYRVLSVESSAHALRRNEATVFPVSFRCLPEDTNGRYGVIMDRVRPTAGP